MTGTQDDGTADCQSFEGRDGAVTATGTGTATGIVIVGTGTGIVRVIVVMIAGPDRRVEVVVVVG